MPTDQVVHDNIQQALARIVDIVAKDTGVSPRWIWQRTADTRSKESRHALARQIAWHIAREALPAHLNSLKGIAFEFGEIQHTTVCAGLRAVKNRMRLSHNHPRHIDPARIDRLISAYKERRGN